MEEDNKAEEITEEKEEKKEKRHLIENEKHREIVSYLIVLVSAVLAALFINTFILTSNVVPTDSMEPTIVAHSRLFGNRLSYNNSDPKRGDIVIFKYPVNEEELFIKRIIGLPGETVQVKDGIVYIDDNELDESSYLTITTNGQFGPYTIPEDSYFMMGDNRNISCDSRKWNNEALKRGLVVDEEHDYTCVKRDKIVSKAWFEYFPKVKLLN